MFKEQSSVEFEIQTYKRRNPNTLNESTKGHRWVYDFAKENESNLHFVFDDNQGNQEFKRDPEKNPEEKWSQRIWWDYVQ